LQRSRDTARKSSPMPPAARGAYLPFQRRERAQPAARELRNAAPPSAQMSLMRSRVFPLPPAVYRLKPLIASRGGAPEASAFAVRVLLMMLYFYTRVSIEKTPYRGCATRASLRHRLCRKCACAHVIVHASASAPDERCSSTQNIALQHRSPRRRAMRADENEARAILVLIEQRCDVISPRRRRRSMRVRAGERGVMTARCATPDRVPEPACWRVKAPRERKRISDGNR
jgi:hypothetical protein